MSDMKRRTQREDEQHRGGDPSGAVGNCDASEREKGLPTGARTAANPERRDEREAVPGQGASLLPAYDRQDNPLTEAIIGAAMEVHRHLGPGLMEASYERALCVELSARGTAFVRQSSVPVFYKGILVGEYRVDLVVEDRVVVEVKSVDALAGVHRAQLLAYMRVLRLQYGLLLNFYGEVLRTGIRRVILTR
jgi:GxxExxY protein